MRVRYVYIVHRRIGLGEAMLGVKLRLILKSMDHQASRIRLSLRLIDADVDYYVLNITSKGREDFQSTSRTLRGHWVSQATVAQT